ncbi:unnamed protein product [Cyclocybe aegerita]|uniref:Zinc finger PHD-type domain-containing protein n=1 Tax=Cyclocybe aegerita TaxID=1973307 RepID=A0A8S0XY06_CYCAE|nr:unnamed protein product [Cyclocybe aegerita]
MRSCSDLPHRLQLRTPCRLLKILFLLHGRHGSAEDMATLARTFVEKTRSSGERSLIVVTLDHRNHGTRLVEPKANNSWTEDTPNQNHAMDMHGIQLGTAHDVSFLVDFLPGYLFPGGEHKVENWGVAGRSLGGHSTWILLGQDPRIQVGIPIIACPDYVALIKHRAKESKVTFGAPYIPATFLAAIEKSNPASQAYRSVAGNPFLGKKILVLSGEADTLVPWTASKEFVDNLEVGTDGVKSVVVEAGVGHRCTGRMVELAVEFEMFRLSSFERDCFDLPQMPRRSQTRVAVLEQTPAISEQRHQSNSDAENLAVLRKQWRWAAFCQFFFTFAPLLAMNDVTIADIERDLTQHTSVVLPRIMTRLLYTLSYDRKVSLDNWQTALRKQYNKRDPQANPIGPEPIDPRLLEDMKEDEDDGEKEKNGPTEPSIHQDDRSSSGDRGSRAPRAVSTSADPIKSEDASQRDVSMDAEFSEPVSCADPATENHEAQQAPSLDWLQLPTLAQLESLHTLAEWQFQNPTRLRILMKSDDELALWRIEPIGYDSKRNAYWFIGTDRLWIQRAPPRPSRPKALKRKRPTQSVAQKKQANGKTTAPKTKRPRLEAQPTIDSPSTSRHSRAAKDQAKMKLDAQAKELAELNRQANIRESKSRSARQTPLRSQPSRTSLRTGTRLSARLRGTQDDEWQPIPDEWLSDGKANQGQDEGSKRKTGLESDEETISDLTELSEDGGELSETESSPSKPPANGKRGKASKAEDAEEEVSQESPEDFVEWETICATLYEWERIAERFQNATHYTEKALYKVLVNQIVPAVTEELREIERKRNLEEAMVHRKRSSRIATKESEKEEARLAAKRKQEEDEKMGRARRLEARQQREEEERIKRETAREQRKKEREAREESRRAQTESAVQSDTNSKSEGKKSKSPQRETRKAKSTAKANGNAPANSRTGSTSGSRTPAGEDWELCCEICQRRGINLDDGTPMMSCGRCSRWQHIQCHDRADQAAGRPRRNWNTVEFICKWCRADLQARRKEYPVAAAPVKQPYPLILSTPQVQAYGSYQHQQLPSISNLHMDHRQAGHYSSSYQQPQQQSYYSRQPVNGHQHPSMYSQHQHSTATGVPEQRQAISFSHYQPSERGFSSGSQRLPTEQHHSYYQSNNSPDSYRQGSSNYYKPPPITPSWNVNTPVQSSGYPMSHNSSTLPSSSSGFRLPPPEHLLSRPVQQFPVHESSHGQHQQSYNRSYPTDQHYPPTTQFKHHPTSYQPPLGR